MLLAVDIGNTNVTLGVFDGETLLTTWRMATEIRRMPDEYAGTMLTLMQLQGIKPADISAISMCTTVPPLLGALQELFQRYFQVSPFVVTAGVKTGVRIRIDNPREAGPDRIVNSAAAHHLYRGPVIVTDIGTATTFDVVSKEGEYVGGVIAPGIQNAAEALFTRAAALPRVEIAAPKNAIGSNTLAAMQSGIVFGYIGLIEGIVERIRRQLGERAMVVATGGHARLVAGETSIIDEVNPEITLIGLRLIYLMNREQD
jgi:type III pantothenate kinase